MNKITVEQVLEWDVCNPPYSEARLRELAPNGSLTPLEVCDLDIPTQHKLWVLLRKDIFPERELLLLRCQHALDWAICGTWSTERAATRGAERNHRVDLWKAFEARALALVRHMLENPSW